jgi:hypothetical protein
MIVMVKDKLPVKHPTPIALNMGLLLPHVCWIAA